MRGLRFGYPLLGASILSTGLAFGQAAPAAPAPSPPQKAAAQRASVKEEASEAREVRVFEVANARATDIARTLAQLGLGGLRLVADERANLLLASGQDAADIQRAEQLIRALDRPVDPSSARGTAIRALPLKHAAVEQVAEQLHALANNNSLRCVPDSSTNTLWISGHETDIASLIEVVNAMDAAGAVSPTTREMRFYTLKHAPAEALAKTLNRTADMLGVQVELVPDQGSGTIIAYGSPDTHSRIAEIIAALDLPQRRTDLPTPRPTAPAAPAAKPVNPG
jgi:type II secretory pathway component GspD/PulD (secretin)